jgi:hypothetical protein
MRYDDFVEDLFLAIGRAASLAGADQFLDANETSSNPKKAGISRGMVAGNS